MGRFLEYWKMAYFNIRMNKARAFLTMLGIIIGIASVVGILSIGSGFSNWVSGSLNGLVGSDFTVYSNGDDDIPKSVMDSLVNKYPEITGYSERISARGTAIDTKNKEVDVTISGGKPIIQETNSAELLYGRFFTDSDYEEAEPVCVIDTYGAKKLFGYEDVTGKTVSVDAYGRELNLRVVGVRKSNQSEAPDYNEKNVSADGEESAIVVGVFEDPSLQFEVPSSYIYRTFGLDMDRYYQVTVFVDEPAHVAEASRKSGRYIEAVMDKRGENAIGVMELTSLVDGLTKVLGGITAFVMLVAAISLFVGGVGVMNIMLVSVTERTREIGIRKSLGARTSSILWQFLIESGMISLTGGIIGTIIGYAFSSLACVIVHLVKNTISIKPDFNILLILGVAVFSMGIGIFFGLYPAGKAARMTPIDALRS
ncbi:MAG: ABC transporter permease [Lachnospiraceae bacterium]|nr:ABC transporter permease [Lachnospiraceae bacterium]